MRTGLFFFVQIFDAGFSKGQKTIYMKKPSHNKHGIYCAIMYRILLSECTKM